MEGSLSRSPHSTDITISEPFSLHFCPRIFQEFGVLPPGNWNRADVALLTAVSLLTGGANLQSLCQTLVGFARESSRFKIGKLQQFCLYFCISTHSFKTNIYSMNDLSTYSWISCPKNCFNQPNYTNCQIQALLCLKTCRGVRM